MKWLEIDYIKQHSRIDFDCEDALLELYATAAEEAVMNLLQRDYQDIVDQFGKVTGDTATDIPVPAAIINATLMICDHLYTKRSLDTQMKAEAVPGVWILLKPYMRLAGSHGNDMRNMYIARLAEQRQILDFKCATIDIRQDTTLTELYGRIATFTNWWRQFDDPANLILADMKAETEKLEKDVEDYLKTLNAN